MKVPKLESGSLNINELVDEEKDRVGGAIRSCDRYFFVYGSRIIYEIMQKLGNAWVCLAWKDIRVNMVKRKEK